MKHCKLCNAYFDAPLIRKERDNTVFKGYQSRVELCPVCGLPYIEDAAVCPKCKGYMPNGEILCKSCRKILKGKLLDFLDCLSTVEQEQLDLWLDGRSISDLGPVC